MGETMRERLARALYEVRPSGRTRPGGITRLSFNECPREKRDELYEFADAVLAEMREPTEAMKKCAEAYWPDDPEQIWQAMIDAAAKATA